MKLSAWLFPFAALFGTANTFAATASLSDYLSCGAQSFSVITQAPFKSLISSKLENGHIKLLGGSKSDMGQRWIFDKPIVVDGISLTGFFAEDIDLMGSRIISWGFYAQQSHEQVAASLKKSHTLDLMVSNNIFARPEIWSEQQLAWLPEISGETAGKLVTDTSERILMIEPAPGDLAGSKGMLTCSIQGKISEAALKSSRPDLLSAPQG